MIVVLGQRQICSGKELCVQDESNETNESHQFERSMLNSEHTEQMQFTQTMRIFWCGQ